MKKLIAAMAFAGVASASANIVEDLSISGSFDYESEYIFRGQNYAGHSFQPGVEFGYGVLGGDAYVGVWSSHEISNNSDGLNDTEVDFYAGYALGLNELVQDLPLVLDVGFTYYMYPDSNTVVAGVGEWGIDRTREAYVGLAADMPLSPALYYYYDFDLEQSVLELSVGHSFDLAEFIDVNASLDIGAYWGFVQTDNLGANQNDALFTSAGIGQENGYSYGGISADIVYALSETASASVGGRYSANNDGSQSLYNGQEHNLWFGSTLSFSK